MKKDYTKNLLLTSTIILSPLALLACGGGKELDKVSVESYPYDDGKLYEILELNKVSTHVDKSEQLYKELAKIDAEKKRIEEEKRIAEEKRLAEEKRKQEEKRRQEEERKSKEEEKKSQWMTFEASYYSAFCKEGCSGRTALGIDVSNTIYYKGMRIIAVDPKVIKLGTIVEVKTNYGTFTAIAADTGGAIKKKSVDILVDSDKTAYSLGRHNVQIRIVSKGE